MRPMKLAILTLALTVAWAGASLLAQHNTAADIEDGGRVFQNTCANCHGPDGNEIAGIDLGRGQFRRTMSDQDSCGIIRTGIPGTPMPGSNFSVEQAERVVAYLRSVAASKRSEVGGRRLVPRARAVRGQGRLRDVSSRQRQRLAARSGPHEHRSAAPGDGSGALAARARRRSARTRTASTAS